MTIRIVTDSTCDLPASLAEEYGITVIPLYINAGGESFLDGVDISREEFYERLPNFRPHATTAVPGVAAFHEAYTRLADAGATGILSIHISRTLSNMGDVAESAAQEFTAVPVKAFDSRNISLSTGLMAVAAARKAAEGASMEDILVTLDAIARCTYCLAALDTVEYLRRSGRMSHVLSSLATLLQIKPLLKMNNGVSSVERVRTRKIATKRLLDLVQKLGPLQKLSIVHTNDPARAEDLRRQAAHLFPDDQAPLIVQVTPVLGAHLGPSATGFVAVTECEVEPPMEEKLWLF